MSNSRSSTEQPSLSIVSGAPVDEPAIEAKSDHAADEAVLDEAERLAADAILDDDDGDEPGQREEETLPLVAGKLPKFANFRCSPVTFDLWGTTDRVGMDDLVFVTTRSFAPNFEDDVELRRVRFFETATTDGVIRLVWCMVPDRPRQRCCKPIYRIPFRQATAQSTRGLHRFHFAMTATLANRSAHMLCSR